MAYTHDPDDITALMTSNTSPSPNVASASSDWGPTYYAWKAFDHVPSPIPNTSLWLANIPTPETPQWLKFDFGESNLWVVNRYTMTNMGTAAGVGNSNNPRDWLFQGSNNDNDWETLNSQEDITWVTDETKEFSFSNAVAYRYYRLLITDYNPYVPYPFLALAELELFSDVEPPAFPADYLVQYRRTRRPGLVAGKIVS